MSERNMEIDNDRYTVVLMYGDDIGRVLTTVDTYDEAISYMRDNYSDNIDLLYHGRFSSWVL